MTTTTKKSSLLGTLTSTFGLSDKGQKKKKKDTKATDVAGLPAMTKADREKLKLKQAADAKVAARKQAREKRKLAAEKRRQGETSKRRKQAEKAALLFEVKDERRLHTNQPELVLRDWFRESLICKLQPFKHNNPFSV
jgi:hypothetical protein